jgi:hypothetical protein
MGIQVQLVFHDLVYQLYCFIVYMRNLLGSRLGGSRLGVCFFTVFKLTAIPIRTVKFLMEASAGSSLIVLGDERLVMQFVGSMSE